MDFLQLNKPSAGLGNVVLIGLPGAGKTEIGKRLAWYWGLGFLDLGSSIEMSEKKKRVGKSTDGMHHTLEIEEKRIANLSSILNHVIVINHFALQSDKIFKILKSIGTLVWIDTPIATIAWRLSRSSTELKKRPNLSDPHYEGQSSIFEGLQRKLKSLFAENSSRYTEAAVTISDSISGPDACARKVMALIESHLRTEPDDTSLRNGF